MSMFETLMEGLAKRTGISHEQICTAGSVHLVFDEKIGVEIGEDATNQDLCFSSRLFQVDAERDLGAIALMLVHANFDQSALDGAHLAMSEGGMVVLLRRVPMQSLNDGTLSKVLDEFVGAASQWSGSVAAMTKLLDEHAQTEASNGDESDIRMRV